MSKLAIVLIVLGITMPIWAPIAIVGLIYAFAFCAQCFSVVVLLALAILGA